MSGRLLPAGSATVRPVAEHVVPLELGITWEPGAPEAVLVSDDRGITALALNRHSNDHDERCVVVVWKGTRSAVFSDPNDEAISGHRLYPKGLSEVTWAGSVQSSATVEALERQNRVHPYHDARRFARLTHHVLLLKECVAEVVAETIEVRRVEGSTLEAAVAVMRSA